MKKSVMISLVLFLYNGINAQSLDSIAFGSDYERKVFEKIDSLSADTSYFESLFAIDSTTTIEKINQVKVKVDKFITSIDQNKIARFSKKKRIKYVFKKVHDRFLRKYKELVNFNEIFNNGTYNCVSASALYSYIFDSLKIPYQIKETPTHIFLVAYPNDANIYIETTIPGNKGFYSASDNDIEKAVLELIKGKLLTRSDVEKIGYKQAYMDFFYNKEYLKPLELVGIQYYNEGLTLFNNEKFEKAYYSFKKAEKFYETKKVKYLKISCLSLLLETSNFNKIKDIKNITTLINSLEYQKDYLKKDVSYYSSNIILANKNNEAFLIKTAKQFKYIKNEDVKYILNLELYRFIAERRFRLGRSLEEILEYAIKIYDLNKEDEEIKNLISNAILKHFFYITPNKKTVEKIETYERKYSFLKNARFYNKYMIKVYAYMTGQYYYKKEPEIGNIYFNKLKEFIKSNENNIEFDQELIGNAYWSIGAHYYGKSKLKKAKEILEEGKKIAPEHHKLNKILGYVNDDLK